MQSHIWTAPRSLGLALAAALLAVLILPRLGLAQTPAPTGVFMTASSTGAAGGDRTLLALAEDGTATIAFINLDESISNISRGVWLLDPYGTVTVEVQVEASESCSGEEAIGTMTFLPSQDSNALTAVHYPECLWGDGSLTLVRVADDTIAAIEDAYAAAGLMPGLVFLSDPLVAADGVERQLTLNLGQNAQAMMISQATGDTTSDDATAVEVGTWEATVYTVTVALTGTAETTYDEPDVLVFGYLKDGSGRMAAYTYDQEKYGDQGVIMTYSPELVDMAEVAMAEAEAETAAATAIPGVYNSDLLPAADSPGLVQTLALWENGNAQNTLNYLNDEAPIVELGTWTDNADGTVTLELTGTPDEQYAEPAVATFTATAGQLEGDGVTLHKLAAVEPATAPATDTAAAEDTATEDTASPDPTDGVPVAYYMSDTLPAASSPGRVIELVLLDNGAAAMRTDYLNDEAPLVELGAWEQTDNSLTVTLTGSVDEEYDAPVTIVFAVDGDQITTVEYDTDLYGEEGFVLTAQPLEALEGAN